MSRNSPEQMAERAARILARWDRLGPVVGRLREIGVGLLCLLGTAVVIMGSSTLGSLYQGTGAWAAGAERAASAEVVSCKSIGPLSPAGFGRWGVCQVVITHASGGTEMIESRPGLFDAADEGQAVAIFEACDENGETCSFGRQSSRMSAVLNTVRGMVGFAMAAAFLLFALVGAFKGVLGIPGWFRVLENMSVSGGGRVGLRDG